MITKQRKGEIALLLLESLLKKEKMQITDLRRRLGNIAKEVNISLEELIEFSKPYYQEALEKELAPLGQGDPKGS